MRKTRLILSAAFALCIAATAGTALAKRKGGGGSVDTDRYDKDCITACQSKQKDCNLDCAHVSSDEENAQCSKDCTKGYTSCARKCPPRKKDRY